MGRPDSEMAGSEAGNESASEFLSRTEARLLELAIESSRADWIYSTFITPDTEALSAKAFTRLAQETAAHAKRAAKLPVHELSPDELRKIRLLRLSLALIPPSDPAESEELSKLVLAMQGEYARGRHRVLGQGEPLDVQALSDRLGESRDPKELLDVWVGWHEVSRPMRPEFTRYVELANRGAKELGFDDTGAMWRSKYDMDPDQFAREVERLWTEVRPLYESLHAYVRSRLNAIYGEEVVPSRGPIPAHMLGNMWAQQWDGLWAKLAPEGSTPTFDLTAKLREKGVDSREMVRYAERFFVSLGFDLLPATFWERSLFERPRDREVVCHASAWDIDADEDIRVKMCIDITGEQFNVIHHELGHNIYQRAYRRQPFLYRDSANDGFHEAIGDTIALSVTPEYLSKVGLFDAPTGPGDSMGPLMHRALEKVAFLPFGLLVDMWRWDVFSGRVDPANYNRAWWELRRKYQGVDPPVPRDESYFDPGGKYHVPANVPYMRYLLAAILQFQFHKALLREAGWTGAMHEGSIFGSKPAGKALARMMEMGTSQPWPEALEAMTGQRRMDASALLAYFSPLKKWLDDQNRGSPVGW